MRDQGHGKEESRLPQSPALTAPREAEGKLSMLRLIDWLAALYSLADGPAQEGIDRATGGGTALRSAVA